MIFAPRAAEVHVWYLAFHEHADARWLRWLPGRFKHVSLIGRVPEMKSWVWLEYHVRGTRVALYPDTQAGRDAIGEGLGEHALLEMFPKVSAKARFWPVMSCVALAQHTLGLPFSALLPDGLWRQCLAYGARIVFDHGIHEAEGAARSAVGSAESG